MDSSSFIESLWKKLKAAPRNPFKNQEGRGSDKPNRPQSEIDVILERFGTAGDLSDEMIEELEWHLKNLVFHTRQQERKRLLLMISSFLFAPGEIDEEDRQWAENIIEKRPRGSDEG